jgi:hypothetical protein
MIVTEKQYFTTDEKTEIELNRLRMLEQLYDPITIRHLETIKVSTGWKCLEVGAGGWIDCTMVNPASWGERKSISG